MSTEQMGQAVESPGEEASLEWERGCERFLYREAELLDTNNFTGWVESCLSPELEYRIPIRTTRERNSGISEFSDVGYHMRESYATMQVRVNRLLTEHAWAEDPPSRVRRLVTNVRVRKLTADEAQVRSYLLIFRSQGDTINYDQLVAERQDTLRIEDGEWRLLRRAVLFDHTILPTPNLGIFF